MSDRGLSTGSDLPEDLQHLSQLIQAAAHQRDGDCPALLDLLRTLESLHSEIRDTLFRDALPNNRQRLYSLLRDIELQGGWPYIQRMKLSAFLVNLDANAKSED
ncbi:hypothetical protein IQ241_15505 [Romeria aff. gracilis LEGE 07310]|uniref:Uncharacterized protein n=1 Tax=Vasconcelosia minhoensis LEGE 07310 TaxID=915328 RepID=A0A8J7DDE2_9CYAN|nr:hypothetical protein [Romeria gracilis]MBE9078683.1 hypothetical protein [Romeria aff. gracilis LEGE 07310]